MMIIWRMKNYAIRIFCILINIFFLQPLNPICHCPFCSPIRHGGWEGGGGHIDTPRIDWIMVDG